MSKKNLSIIMLALVLTSVIACNQVLAKKPTQPQPHDLHGEGYGFYNSPEGRWVGSVWAHYDENGAPWIQTGIWEVGVEGLSSSWYTMGFVTSETFNGNVLVARGTFEGDDPEWPLGDRNFVYIANFKTMRWILNGEGFHFKGIIEEINAYDVSSRKPMTLVMG